MPAPRKYPQELRERAIRLVVEAREQDPELSVNAAVMRIGSACRGEPGHAARVGASRPTIDAGRRPGTTHDDARDQGPRGRRSTS